MSLSEKRLSQQSWQNRLERERHNISVSVEETLATNPDEQWLEEAEEDEIGGGSRGGSGTNTALIPPRLSLQSKMLPALRPGGFVQSATAAHAAFQQSQVHEKQQEQRQASSQTNIFARLAQRLTSSFAALSLSQGEQIPPSEPLASPGPALHPLVTAHQPYPEQSLSRYEHQVVISSPSPTNEVNEHLSQHSTQMPRAKIIDAIPATPSTRPFVAPQSTEPQRLAGRATKIRLQTAPQSSLPPISQQVVTSEKEHTENVSGSEMLCEPVVVSVHAHDVSQVTTHPDLPALSSSSEQRRRDLTQQECTHGTLFGTHAFESGQAEVMIEQDRVQASSVVQVTLTSNPGQTLVQYISLHPQRGFTVHLTSPVSAKTSFNYVLFA